MGEGEPVSRSGRFASACVVELWCRWRVGCPTDSRRLLLLDSKECICLVVVPLDRVTLAATALFPCVRPRMPQPV